jgi:hypothetical protein
MGTETDGLEWSFYFFPLLRTFLIWLELLFEFRDHMLGISSDRSLF